MEIQDQENEDKASMIAVSINSFNNYALHLHNEYIYIIGMEDVGSNSDEDSKSACYLHTVVRNL